MISKQAPAAWSTIWDWNGTLLVSNFISPSGSFAQLVRPRSDNPFIPVPSASGGATNRL